MISTSLSRSRSNSCGDQAEDEDVLAAVLGGAADGLDGGAGDGDADVADAALVLEVRLDVVGVVDADAAVAERADVVVVAVLVEGDQEVGLVAGGEDLARAEVDLEDGRAAGDGRRDGHVGHDLLGGAAGESGRGNRRWTGCRPANCPAKRMTALDNSFFGTWIRRCGIGVLNRWRLLRSWHVLCGRFQRLL